MNGMRTGNQYMKDVVELKNKSYGIVNCCCVKNNNEHISF